MRCLSHISSGGGRTWAFPERTGDKQQRGRLVYLQWEPYALNQGFACCLRLALAQSGVELRTQEQRSSCGSSLSKLLPFNAPAANMMEHRKIRHFYGRFVVRTLHPPQTCNGAHAREVTCTQNTRSSVRREHSRKVEQFAKQRCSFSSKKQPQSLHVLGSERRPSARARVVSGMNDHQRTPLYSPKAISDNSMWPFDFKLSCLASAR